MMESAILGPEEEREVKRFRRALQLEHSFAFHVIVADTKQVLDAALGRLEVPLYVVRPRASRDLLAEEAATQILAEINRSMEAAAHSPLLIDAMSSHQEPAWIFVFRRLNELRNGIEKRHDAPLVLALLPQGETVLGHQAPDLWSKRGSGMRLHDQIAVQAFSKATTAVEILPPPDRPSVFEALCLDIFREIWNDPGARRNDTRGKSQDAVDIAGRMGSRTVGVHCIAMGRKIVHSHLASAVKAATRFKPSLDTFIVATAGPGDASIEELARRLSESSPFQIEVWPWDRIWHELVQRADLLGRIFPLYWPTLARLEKLAPQKCAPSRLPHFSGELFGRDEKLAALETAWQAGKTRILSIVGWGGVGKTSLLAKWTADLAGRSFDGADYFDWSFYSQGVKNQKIVTADSFVDAGLRFFGDAAMADSSRPAWDKGVRLAELVGRRRTLLVLDGLELLQRHSQATLPGEVKDPCVKALLRGLAQRNAGLCVVTSRSSVADLANHHPEVVQEWILDPLTVAAGKKLLRALGVRGSEPELADAVKSVDGHALSLDLLGRFLRSAHAGDVRKRAMVRLADADEEVRGGHALRVMAAYERWLEAEEEPGKRQLALLFLLSLFDRPASTACLDVLRSGPAIPGLTEPLANLTDRGWNLVVRRLTESGLVSKDEEALDSHPLVRGYFSQKLRGRNRAAWSAAHGRLFDFLKDNTEDRPETLAGLQPLYQAVYHGCQAERQAEACEVYRDRILRGTGASGYYSMKKLGAFGADLAAVSCFFETPWSRVSPALSEANQAWLLRQAAFCLQALGRLGEAVEPMRAGLEVVVAREDWKSAAQTASSLSELHLTLGEVSRAAADAGHAVAFADRSGDAYQRMASRTTLADAKHQAGEVDAALVLFREAEQLQAERQPEYPLLYSLPGFRYCDILLAGAERAAGSGQDARAPSRKQEYEVEQRASQTLEWMELNRASLLDIALDRLTLGRVLLYTAILTGQKSSGDAQIETEKAVSGLRAAEQIQHLPGGLLTRAWLRTVDGDLTGARADLDEAQDIAERGSMALRLADVALYRARLFRDRHALAEARRLVEEQSYGRRRDEIADLEAAASSW